MRSSYRGTKEFLSLGTRYWQQQVTLPSNLPSRTIRRALSLSPQGRGGALQTEMVFLNQKHWGNMRHGRNPGECVALWASPERTRPLRHNHPSLVFTHYNQTHQTYSGHPPFQEKQVYFFSAFKQTHGKMENCQSLSCGATRLEKENIQITHKHTQVCTCIKCAHT